jgi:hypothetical protein
MCRRLARIRNVNQAPPNELRQALLKRERSVAPRDGDLLVEVLQRVLPYVLAGTIAHDEQFGSWHPPSTVPRKEYLSHDRCESHRQLLPYRRLTFKGKRVGHA